MDLELLGWNEFFELNRAPWDHEGNQIGRIIRDDGQSYWVSDGLNQVIAELSGKFRFDSDDRSEYPAVGDWVVYTRSQDDIGVITAVLPRKSKISRKEAGIRMWEQILAANVDIVFIVTALDREFNSNRLERYMLIVMESGADGVIILNKVDKCQNPDETLADVRSIVLTMPIIMMSAVSQKPLDELDRYMNRGVTAVFIGSSGVGKSTIINRLAGETIAETADVRDSDDRGRHTTTSRSLIVLPQGGIVIDTPGMREIQLWADHDSLAVLFPDIEQLSESCRFRNCTHAVEPDCAVLSAVEDGSLNDRRHRSYLKMRQEIEARDRRILLTKERKGRHRKR